MPHYIDTWHNSRNLCWQHYTLVFLLRHFSTRPIGRLMLALDIRHLWLFPSLLSRVHMSRMASMQRHQ